MNWPTPCRWDGNSLLGTHDSPGNKFSVHKYLHISGARFFMAKAKSSAEERRSSLVEECWPSEGEDVMGCVPPVLQTEWEGV